MADAEERIRQVLAPILGSLGLTLWDLEFQKQGPNWLLRVYIDRETGGATLNDCEVVSRDLGTTLDVEDFLQHAYVLEVSTPGLDRTLSLPEHYSRFIGSMIRVKTYQPLNGQKVFRGKLIGLNEGAVLIEEEKSGILEIPLKNITKASLEVEW